jgi:hypothetical protein
MQKMNKEQLESQNLLLRQQVELLTDQLEQLIELNKSTNTETNLNWLELVGKVQNESGAAMIRKAETQYHLLLRQKNSQGGIGSERPNEVKIEEWSNIHEAEFQSCRVILENKEEAHAVCEVRERQRNSTLGLLPNVSELSEIISTAKSNKQLQTASDNAAEIQFLQPEQRLSR